MCYYGAFHTLVQCSVFEETVILCVERFDVNIQFSEVEIKIDTISFPHSRG